ncbi:MAG: XrtA system polysaccharide deacetylase [Candidatus Zixiibacteriota bacterium]
MKNILTFDVEEYFQVEAFYGVIPRDDWDKRQSRITMCIIRILDILDEYKATGTFFTLGWVAERYPHLPAMIKGRGHELASHGYGHDSLKRLDAEQFRADLMRSVEAIEKAAGVRVRGYRAPTFSVDRNKEWIWETLAECGFEFDSSIYPIHHDLYGDPLAPRYPYVINTAAGKLLEIPPTTYSFMGKRLPACGGGSFRLFPYWYTKRATRAYNSSGYPAMVYLHPWEIDPTQPREKNAGVKSRLRHYTNLHTVEPKLRRLLAEFPFGSVSEVYATNGKSLLETVKKGSANA